MKIWTYGVNSVYKTATYILEEGPWYSFFFQNLVMSICSFIPSIPIPFGSKIKVKDEDKKYLTLKEEYGDFSDLFHLIICSKICNFLDRKIDIVMEFPANYNEVKKKLEKKNPELFE